MQWVTASMPVAAVIIFGRPKVRSGSQIATVGTRLGEAKVSLRPLFSVVIMPIETSEPVPAVVGMAIKGGSFLISFDPPTIAA